MLRLLGTHEHDLSLTEMAVPVGALHSDLEGYLKFKAAQQNTELALAAETIQNHRMQHLLCLKCTK